MMRDQDKPFVMYRRSRFNFNIVPRGLKGWLWLGLWLGLLAPPTIAFISYAEAHEGTPQFIIALVLFLLVTVAWSIAMIWWMKARAEIIDVNALIALKRETGRKEQRRGR
ncbi:MAG: hypothetical protein ACK4IC_06515 [Erythrobacter sp.]